RASRASTRRSAACRSILPAAPAEVSAASSSSCAARLCRLQITEDDRRATSNLLKACHRDGRAERAAIPPAPPGNRQTGSSAHGSSRGAECSSRFWQTPGHVRGDEHFRPDSREHWASPRYLIAELLPLAPCDL